MFFSRVIFVQIWMEYLDISFNFGIKILNKINGFS